MQPSFDAYEYIDSMRRRWRAVVAACAIAVIVALAVSMLTPKRYTATASIVIEPPGTNDLRTTTAVSPVYLESLKSFERFAASDTLFARAVENFHLQEGASVSIESLKRRVLKVTKPRDTKILEIAATLPDPRLAQTVAQFLAEETVALNRGQNLAADREWIDQAQQQVADAKARLASAQAARSANAARETVEALSDEVGASTDLLAKARQELMATEADEADYAARIKSVSSSPASTATDSTYLRQQLDATRARILVLRRRIVEWQNSVAAASATLGQRTARADQLRADLSSAQAAFEAASTRWREAMGVAGARGERLRLLDPGIVPQRPSSPNVPLNVIAAFFAALVLSIAALSAQFAFVRGRLAHRDHRATRTASMR
jgi:polysaccharide biosynthesis transport protein